MDTTTIIILALVVLAVIGGAAWLWNRRQQTEQLREKFGSEYDYTVSKVGDQRQAEAELEKREERVEALEIQALSPEERSRFLERWKETQARFVDEPAQAVNDADRLIQEAMMESGFPVADFEQRAADISVMHPGVVSDYRAAHEIAMNNERGEASTEDLRQAMVHYRSLFEDLL